MVAIAYLDSAKTTKIKEVVKAVVLENLGIKEWEIQKEILTSQVIKMILQEEEDHQEAEEDAKEIQVVAKAVNKEEEDTLMRIIQNLTQRV